MPHTKDHKSDGSGTADRDMTQQSGYTPASDYGEHGTREEVTNRAKGATAQVKEGAREAGEMAKEGVDKGMDKAADGMESAAGTVREKAQERGGMTKEYGTMAADVMESSATYLRDHDSGQVMDDVEQYVRRHPMQAVAGAVIGGFILGRILG